MGVGGTHRAKQTGRTRDTETHIDSDRDSETDAEMYVKLLLIFVVLCWPDFSCVGKKSSVHTYLLQIKQ